MEVNPGTLRQRYQACLDVLGFIAALARLGAVNLANAYDTAIKISKLHRETAKRILTNPGVIKLGEPQEGVDVPIYPNIFHVEFFSDTIFVFTIDDSDESLSQLSEICYLIFTVFMRQGLTLRGGIARGESIVFPEDNLYVGQGIVEAYKLEQSLDLVGIVLQKGLACSASRPALITYKCGHSEELHVPIHRDAMVYGEAMVRQFEFARAEAGSKYTQRYANSVEVVAAMGKISPELLRVKS
jgi:hypothetical protein